jgi:chaperonin cofactor prefoldin
LRVELDSVRRETEALTQALRREISEQRTAHEQRVETLNEAQAQARSSLADLRSQLEARLRENTNLTTLNNALSVRIDKTQATLSSTDARLQALNAQRTAEQREGETLQAMMTARLADKDAIIASLQQQMAEPPSDPDAPVKNGIGGA